MCGLVAKFQLVPIKQVMAHIDSEYPITYMITDYFHFAVSLDIFLLWIWATLSPSIMTGSTKLRSMSFAPNFAHVFVSAYVHFFTTTTLSPCVVSKTPAPWVG